MWDHRVVQIDWMLCGVSSAFFSISIRIDRIFSPLIREILRRNLSVFSCLFTNCVELCLTISTSLLPHVNILCAEHLALFIKSASSNMPAATHIVRFVANEDSRIHIGQLVDTSRDVGLDSIEGRKIEAYLINGTIFDGEVTDKVYTVKHLLSPVSVEDCNYIRCLGLNYKDHAKVCSSGDRSWSINQ